jgi:FtsZ-interacting cell division protein ZipA
VIIIIIIIIILLTVGLWFVRSQVRFCDECKCYVCRDCNCSVFHLSYQVNNTDNSECRTKETIGSHHVIAAR